MTPEIHREKQTVALYSLVASLALSLLKFAAALVSGSLGLLSEALHSLFDFGATAVTLIAVRLADRPADADHHYGHAKFESVAALIETAMLFGISIWIVTEAVRRLLQPGSTVEVSWWLFAILGLSVVVDWNRSRALARTAQRTSSEALAADALHFRADMFSSIAVATGLALVWAGLPKADAVTALIVAVLIAKAAWQLGRKTLGTLLDAAPAGVATAIEEIALATKAVLAIRQLRIRPAGPVLFIDLSVDVPRTLPVPEIATIREQLERDVLAAFTSADVTVTAVPVALDTESAFEKVSLIASEHRAAIHHLLVQDIGGSLAVSFDLEVDGGMSLLDAHDKATRLENAVRDGLGDHVEVESHIEPLPPRLLQGQPVTGRSAKAIAAQLQKLGKTESRLSDIHNIRVRKTDGGIFVHYHCRFAPRTSVDDVHAAVDRIEIKLCKSRPEIARVIAHAEPLGKVRHKF